jgi:hypothetical protein
MVNGSSHHFTLYFTSAAWLLFGQLAAELESAARARALRTQVVDPAASRGRAAELDDAAVS